MWENTVFDYFMKILYYMVMNTNIFTGDKRRLALISLFASLCSVFAVQLAVRWSSSDADLSATASETYDVSVLGGQRGTMPQDAEYRDTGKVTKGVQGTAIRSVYKHGAAGTRMQRVRQARGRE